MCCNNARNAMGRNSVRNQSCGESCNMHTSTTIRNRTTEPMVMVQRFFCRNVPVICDKQVTTESVCTKVAPIGGGVRFDVTDRCIKTRY